jgi:large conductance mechanosensitive channel
MERWITDSKARHEKEREVLKDFKAFLLKQNALALAVAVIIGSAIGKVVTSLVEDVINPLLGRALPGGDWRNARIVLGSGLDPKTGKPFESAITYGHLLGSVVDFVIIAAVVYMISRLFLPKPHEKAPATRECPQCREIIPAEATRCRACTQSLPPLPPEETRQPG